MPRTNPDLPARWTAALVLVLGQESALPRESPALQLGGGNATGLSAARDLTGEGTAFLEIVPERTTVLVEERLHLAIRVGLAEDFLEQHLVQLFQRALDLPVQLDLTALDALPSASSGGSTDPVDGVTLAVDEDIVRVPRPEIVERDGRRYRVLTLQRTLLPTLPGSLMVPVTTMRFAYTTRFEEDLFQGRVATDRIDARVHSEPLELAVVPWPEEGRPQDFGGAVGVLEVRASADPRDLVLGQSLRLVLTFSGAGNLDRFQAPRLEGLDGFAVLGVLDEPAADVRTVTYDLAPRSAKVTAIPAIPFTVLEPGPPPAYRTVETQSIPILVRPGQQSADAPRTAPAEESSGEAARDRRWIPPIVAIVLAGLATLVGRRLMRRRSR
jgi:hypothetical protein